MKPGKNSEFRSLESFIEFIKKDGSDSKKLAPNITAVIFSAPKKYVNITYRYRNFTNYPILQMSEEFIRFRMVGPVSARDEISNFINGIIHNFGLRLSRTCYGTKDEINKWVVKKTNQPIFGAESDFRSYRLRDRENIHDEAFIMDWNGRLKNFTILSESEVTSRLKQNKTRAAIGRKRFTAAKELGFIDTMKLWGYPLPKDLSPKNIKALNSLAKSLGYSHVAEAWASDICLVLSESERPMVDAGLDILYGQLVAPHATQTPIFERRYRS